MSQPRTGRFSLFRARAKLAAPSDDRQNASSPAAAAHRLAAQARAASRAGRRAEALQLLDQALLLDEDHLEALLWRGGLSDPWEALPYLERANALYPDDARASEGLEWARQRVGLPAQAAADVLPVTAPRDAPSALPKNPQKTPGPSKPNRLTRPLLFLFDHLTLALPFVIASLLLGLLVTVSLARIDVTQDETAALPAPDAATVVAGAEPAAAPSVTPTVTPTCTATVSPTPQAPSLLDQAWSSEDWPRVIAIVEEMVKNAPGDSALAEKLFSAHFNYAMQLVRSEKLADAIVEFDKSLQISRGDVRAVKERQSALERLKPAATATATPAPAAASAAGKKIEVDIAKQQVTAWENGKVVYRFKASTGKAPYLTRKGNFSILSKMPNAYSSAMLWGMPWWMGIYYAGKWENGFHAMARVGKKQTVLPESMLGRPQTHGCIMLSDKNAKTLYDWAVIGTAVWIH